jgi:hypothetical protein
MGFSQLSLNRNQVENVVMKGDPDNFTSITPTRKGEPAPMMPAGRRN